ESVVSDPAVVVTFIGQATPSSASSLRPDVMNAVESITNAMWPGVIVVPVMAAGATDGLFLRNAGIPTYGIEGVFVEISDNRSHGQDERVGMKQYFESVEFSYRLI